MTDFNQHKGQTITVTIRGKVTDGGDNWFEIGDRIGFGYHQISDYGDITVEVTEPTRDEVWAALKIGESFSFKYFEGIHRYSNLDTIIPWSGND